MKTLIMIIATIAFVGCSSSKKANQEALAHQEEMAASTKSITDIAKSDIENAAEDLKSATENKAADLKATAENKAVELKDAANAKSEALKSKATAVTFGEYAGTESSTITCKTGEDVRTISVLNGDNGGCGVVYNKFGETKTVAVANSNTEYCTQVQEKIKANLEAPGFFTCE